MGNSDPVSPLESGQPWLPHLSPTSKSYFLRTITVCNYLTYPCFPPGSSNLAWLVPCCKPSTTIVPSTKQVLDKLLSGWVRRWRQVIGNRAKSPPNMSYGITSSWHGFLEWSGFPCLDSSQSCWYLGTGSTTAYATPCPNCSGLGVPPGDSIPKSGFSYSASIQPLWACKIQTSTGVADLQDSDPSSLFQLYRQYPFPPPSPLISSQLRCVHLPFLKLKPLLRPLLLPQNLLASSHLSKSPELWAWCPSPLPHSHDIYPNILKFLHLFPPVDCSLMVRVPSNSSLLPWAW